jgi:flagellar hook-associated protein 3 FlgL
MAVALLNQDRQNVNQVVQEVSSGQSVNQLSDNPVAAASLTGNHMQADAVDQFTRSITSVQGFLGTADSALHNVVNALNHAISLGTEGANGGLSDSQRQAIAQQVGSLEQQIMGFANTTYQGTYLFAGTAVNTPPYVADNTSPSGIKYVGNGSVNEVQVAEGLSIAMNVPGSKIFNGTGADAFQALTDLSNALQANGNIAGATSEVTAALTNVNLQRTFYGGTLDQLNNETFSLTQEKLTLTQQQNALIGADPAQAASELMQAQVTLQGTLAAFSKITQNSLLDYLK